MSPAAAIPLPPLPELINDELCSDLVQLDRQGREIIQRFHQVYFQAYAEELTSHLTTLNKRSKQLTQASDSGKKVEDLRAILNRMLQWAESLRHEQLAKAEENRRGALQALENSLLNLVEPLPAEKEILLPLEKLATPDNAPTVTKIRRIGQRFKANIYGGKLSRTVSYEELANFYLRQQFIQSSEEVLLNSVEQEKRFWEHISDALLLLERYLRVNLLNKDKDTERLLAELEQSFNLAGQQLVKFSDLNLGRLLYLFRLSTQKLADLLENPDSIRKIQQVQQQYAIREIQLGAVLTFPNKWRSGIQPSINTVYAQILLLRLQNRMKLETDAWHVQHQAHIIKWKNTLSQLKSGNYPLPEQMPGPASLQSQRQDIQLSLIEKIHKQPERLRIYPAAIPDRPTTEEEELASDYRFDIETENIQWTRTLSYIVDNQLFSPLRTEAARHDEQLSYYRQQVLDALSLLVFVADNKEAAAQKGESLEENIREVITKGEELLTSLSSTANSSIDLALQQAVNMLSYEAVLQEAETLQKEWQTVQGTKLKGQVQGFAMRSGKRAQQALARLLYSSSEGWLLARQVLHEPPRGINLARLLHLKSEICPRPGVWENLPPLYKNLFTHSSVIGQDFWVNRKKELAAVEQAITWHRQGQAGALIITGPPGMGKTALCRRALNSLAPSQRVYFINPPRSGSASLKVWKNSLEDAVGSSLTSDMALNRLDKFSAIVIPDLELWWERRPGGLEVINELLRLIRQHGDRLLFVFTANTATLNILEQLTAISEHALLIMESQPMSARQLQELILIRHRAGGLKLFWKNQPEEEISAFSVARLFSQLFSYSLGNPGLTLTGWLAAIDRVEGKNIYIDKIVQPDFSPLNDLPSTWQIWLSQFVLHRNLTSERLARLLPGNTTPTSEILGHLQRAGLITAIQPDIYQVQDTVAPLVYRSLVDKGVINGKS
jgi:ABC-type transport system involved in cytochrome c biogenesis ATPase subunit